MEREQMDDLWESVYYTADMKRRIKDMAPALVEFLMKSLLTGEEIDIGTFDGGDGSSGSCVCYDVYNRDKILELYYKNDTAFELHVALENHEFDIESFFHTLTDKEVAIIPEGLQILMKKAFDKGKGMVCKPKLIEK